MEEAGAKHLEHDITETDLSRKIQSRSIRADRNITDCMSAFVCVCVCAGMRKILVEHKKNLSSLQ